MCHLEASEEVGRALQEAAHVLGIMVFLHSAKDFSSVLRLYGMSDGSARLCRSYEEYQSHLRERKSIGYNKRGDYARRKKLEGCCGCCV
jgi:hypothetical protein